MEIEKKITSKIDLLKILSKCQKCQRITISGKLICSYENLKNIVIDQLTNKNKICFILNTNEIDESKIGHWFNLIIFKNVDHRIAIVCDGLGIIEKSKKIMTTLRLFCKKNKMTLHFLKTRYQQKSSKICGYLALFFIFKASNCNLQQFLKLDNILNKTSIQKNENLLYKHVIKHFHL